MKAQSRQQFVAMIQRLLAAGPIPQDELITRLQQAGFRSDIGQLYLVCSEHGLADLQGTTWVPRSWSNVSEREPKAGATRADHAAAGKVNRLISALGVPTSEPALPVIPVPGAWPAIAEAAIRALQEEFNHTSKRKTVADVPLIDGTESGRAGTRKLMRFEVEGDLAVAEGTSATLIVSRQGYESEIVSVFGSVVTLSVPAETPWTRRAALRLDLSWLLREQCKRLQELVDGGPGFNAAAALAVASREHPARPSQPVRLSDADSRRAKLNDGQRAAVEKGLSAGVTWLWGPPGTGKTKTLTELVLQLVSRGKRVLLSAPTNAALDVAVTRVLAERPRLADGDFVRLGQPADTTLAERKAGAVLVDEIAAERGAEIAQARVEAGRALADCRKDLDRLKGKDQLGRADQHRRARLEQTIAGHLAEIKALNRGMMQVRRQVCRDARVVAATAHQVVLETLKGLAFDVVILDEASMTSAALAMLVAGSGNGHTIIAGDFRQLPPIAQADTAEVQDWLRRSPFERAGIDRAVAERRAPSGLAALTEQYRMKDDIGAVISKAFYPESPLVTAEAVRRRAANGARARWASSELLILDTSSLRPRTARRQGMQSRYNVPHLQLAAALLDGGDAIESLGLVTPFAPQARLLESLLPQGRGDEWAASTVHRFQGGERDVIVYDTVDTGFGVERRHRWFTDGYAGSDGARLLNVAASRAREHLVVVGAFDNFRWPGGNEEAVHAFFAQLRYRAHNLDWRRIVDESPTTMTVTTDLVERLRSDVRDARNVDMWLPQGDMVGLPPLLEALKSVPREGDAEAVTLWVEPDSDGQLPVEALYARREGVNIRPVAPVLESFAVIGSVVWSSSKSLLGPAPGVVLRTENGALADAIRRVQRRRSDLAPGTGQLGQECGRCERMLIRYETSLHGGPAIRHECRHCDRFQAGRRGSVGISFRTGGSASRVRRLPGRSER